MIQITPQMRMLVAIEPADFRKGIDGLARLCQDVLKQDPFRGWVFVFRNRKTTAVKVLGIRRRIAWEFSGTCFATPLPNRVELRKLFLYAFWFTTGKGFGCATSVFRAGGFLGGQPVPMKSKSPRRSPPISYRFCSRRAIRRGRRQRPRGERLAHAIDADAFAPNRSCAPRAFMLPCGSRTWDRRIVVTDDDAAFIQQRVAGKRAWMAWAERNRKSSS